MDAKNFVVDHCSKSQIVEHFSAGSPDIERAVLSDALVIESVNLCDKPGFMVSPEQRYSIFVPDFQCKKQQESLNAISTPVNIITHEDIVGIRGKATDFKQFEQVIELAMDVAADGDWAADSDHIQLCFHDLLGSIAQLLHQRFV